MSVLLTLRADLLSGGGGRSVKNGSSLVVELGRKDGSSTSAPDRTKFRLHGKFVLAAASALIFWTAFGLSQSVKAEGTFTVAGINSTLPAWSPAANSEQPSQPHQQYADDSAFSALTSFAQQIGAEAPKPASAKTSDSQFNDQAFSELRAFAQRIGAGQPESIKDQPKLAEAGQLARVPAQGALHKRSRSEKAERPGRGRKTKSKRAPVEAHFVGAKVCLTCHARQVAAFEKTLMGRIGKTQKGKFDCENCHGPGSAHVKAGGGRGVGGIISFRPEDQAAHGRREQRRLSRLPREGRPHLLERQHA